MYHNRLDRGSSVRADPDRLGRKCTQKKSAIENAVRKRSANVARRAGIARKHWFSIQRPRGLLRPARALMAPKARDVLKGPHGCSDLIFDLGLRRILAG